MTKRRIITWSILCLLFAGFYFATRHLGEVSQRSTNPEAVTQMKHVGELMVLYKNEHNGALPPTLDELASHAGAAEGENCLFFHDAGKRYRWIYYPVLKGRAEEKRILVALPFSGNGRYGPGRVVLYTDMQCGVVLEEQFIKEIAE